MNAAKIEFLRFSNFLCQSCHLVTFEAGPKHGRNNKQTINQTKHNDWGHIKGRSSALKYAGKKTFSLGEIEMMVVGNGHGNLFKDKTLTADDGGFDDGNVDANHRDGGGGWWLVVMMTMSPVSLF